jgi:hypothetical protein
LKLRLVAAKRSEDERGGRKLAKILANVYSPAMSDAETKNPLALRRDGKGNIWSHIRQDWYVDYPEETVRQHFVRKLVNDYVFSLEQMDEEIATQHGRGSVEADIVIWRTIKDRADKNAALKFLEKENV